MEDTPSMNYFTCTLGEATQLRKSSSEFKTVNRLIRLQAERHPNLPAVAFPVLSKSSSSHRYEAFTFKDLYAGSLETAASFCKNDDLEPGKGNIECVALLCHSSIDFLLAWLGLIRAGFSVLLIAPQCNSAAIISLCKSCKVTRLYHDNAHSDLASTSAAESGSYNLQAFSLPLERSGLLQSIRSESMRNLDSSRTEHSSKDVAYIHHSSGTSSGIPKPIPQTHHGAVGVLPCLQGQNAATFTTTPLYHGGIADCFRAWTSNALIWLFPGADAPITSDTIISCLSISKTTAEEARTPLVKYFSSVPYILQMLSETSGGLKALQEMDIVGVGGAALPENVGNRLVAENVNLVSRFGSAECGFILSSHRVYAKDKDWQYLRVPKADNLLRFEKVDDDSGLSELIVLPNWPHMAKRNKYDGSYATSDLFEPHPTIKSAWKYHSRSDSQITLLTGKKFDPAPLEDGIKSSSSLIDDIFIFGNDRQMPGALVIPSKSTNTSSEVLKQDIWKIIQEFNSKQQPHSRIAQTMFHVLSGESPPLERSSKGTLLRGQAEKVYTSIIDGMYQSKDARRDGLSGKSLSSRDLESTIRNIVFEVMGNDADFTGESDFFQQGVDSTKATQIRSLLQQNISHDTLPWNIVYDCENITGLIRYFANVQNQNGIAAHEDSRQNMMDLASKYSIFSFSQGVEHGTAKRSPDHRTVILTGATGGLGAHILHGLRVDSSINRIICLVRARDETNARDRVSQSLIQRRLDPISPQDNKISCYPAQLGQDDLGFSAEITSTLRETVTHIIHAAWAVNFSLSLGSFVNEHISGLHSLIKLAASCHNFEQFAFCSSTASVIGQASESEESSISEVLYPMPPPAESLGYSKSKWVAETICSKAAETSRLLGKVKILRVGQLTGDTRNGIWNRSEAWPLMLSAARELQCLPKLDESLSWLPVDIAARAVIDISLPQQPSDTEQPCTVYHLVNNDQTSKWTDLLRWINKTGGENLAYVEPSVWLAKLENLDQHPAQSLLGLWRSNFGNSTDAQDTKIPIVFDTRNAMSASPCMRNIEPVDEKLIEKIWRSLQESTGSV
ncbi:hypothetical protein VTL71DRAFT_6783 [Oculimacula yallundae]|uniref:Carrier domain-containing protein n=1 Tax=Oculimacula yallundae TaxID=86028 RepID=A0ABR4BYM3_9HELO